MNIDKKELARSLKLLATTPAAIEREKEVCRAKLAEIDAEEKKGVWGKTTLDNRRQEAREARNRTCNALVKQMRQALDFVAANNNYADSETVDFESPKLQAALRTIEYMGRDLDLADQAGILNKFVGDIGALRVLEKTFAKHGLYLKGAAHEMQKPLSEAAIREMGEVISFAEYAAEQGRFNVDFARATWSMGDFQKQLDRLGLDDSADPYDAVVQAAVDEVDAEIERITFDPDMSEIDKANAKAQKQAQLLRLKIAQEEMRKAQERGENPGAVLNAQLAKMEAADLKGE